LNGKNKMTDHLISGHKYVRISNVSGIRLPVIGCSLYVQYTSESRMVGVL
jgi:hypothetical protein